MLHQRELAACCPDPTRFEQHVPEKPMPLMLMRAWLLASVGMGGLKFVRNCVLSCRNIHSENLAPVLIHHGATRD
jgi:hypothetical protein